MATIRRCMCWSVSLRKPGWMFPASYLATGAPAIRLLRTSTVASSMCLGDLRSGCKQLGENGPNFCMRVRSCSNGLVTAPTQTKSRSHWHFPQRRSPIATCRRTGISRCTDSTCLGASSVNGGVKPRINGEQRVAEATTCRVERQGVASRQAALRLLRCAPALWVTRRNPLTQLAFMAGSRLPAVNDPLCENTAIQKVNPHILCSPLFGAFGSPPTSSPRRS